MKASENNLQEFTDYIVLLESKIKAFERSIENNRLIKDETIFRLKKENSELKQALEIIYDNLKLYFGE